MMTARPDNERLRSFGLVVGGIFGAIGLWPTILRGHHPRLWVLALGLVLVLPALAWPRSLEPVYRTWMAVGQVLNWVNTRVILGVIFYGLVTPMGLALRLLGHDPMRHRFESSADTYRVGRSPRAGNHMLRQF